MNLIHQGGDWQCLKKIGDSEFEISYNNHFHGSTSKSFDYYPGGGNVKEYPILFSGEMVRAILEGQKSQTRRIIKPEILDKFINLIWNPNENINRCPFGQPGDRLWVRETFNNNWCDHIIYKADGGSAKAAGYAKEPIWKPSIHMPHWASRITLEIDEVRVERLQDIDDDGAIAEGALSYSPSTKSDWSVGFGVACFRNLWDSTCAKRGFGWEVNPFCWVIKFHILEVAS